MISGKNIIAIASNWHFDPTSKHHVMKILSEQNNVLWVNYHGSRRPKVSAFDARAVLRKLKQVAQGPEWVSETMVVLTGGEPMLRPDLCELARHSSGLGLMVVVGTNGTLLDEARVAALMDAGVGAVGISLDSLDPVYHDRFRGRFGAWRKTLAGIEGDVTLRRFNLSLDLLRHVGSGDPDDRWILSGGVGWSF